MDERGFSNGCYDLRCGGRQMSFQKLASFFAMTFIAFFILVACTSSSNNLGDEYLDPLSSDEYAPPPDEPSNVIPLQFKSDSEKKSWIAKVVRLLRYGRPLNRADPMDEWLRMNSVAFVNLMMNTPEFLDTILDFNLYFLGAKEGRLKDDDGIYVPEVLYYPNALRSAREYARRANYNALLTNQQPFYSYPLGPIVGSEGQPLNLGQKLNELNSYYGSLLHEVGSSEFKKERFCDHISRTYFVHWRGTGLKSDLLSTLVNVPAVFRVPYHYCLSDTLSRSDVAEAIQTLMENTPILLKELSRLHPNNYHVRNVLSFRELKLEPLVPNLSSTFRWSFWWKYQNTSTNRNRKRAAAILKQYFCDDLIPINVVVPSLHARGDKHSNDPACYSCHHRLDPMAGFFRDIGWIGTNYSQERTVQFDDLATLSKTSYQEPWRAGNGSNRQWDVGYIRSSQNAKYNSYGDGFDSLFRIVRSSPESKTCLIRKMAMYLLGENQTLDSGYVDYLTQEYREMERDNSSYAIRQIIRRLTHSNSFLNLKADDTQCYDYQPGDDPSVKPPCKVAFLFEKNCGSCHGGLSPSGDLNLTKWISTSKGMGFPHMKSGQQVNPKATFQTIAERLTTSDEDLRMPLLKYISPQDLQALYVWAVSMSSDGRNK